MTDKTHAVVSKSSGNMMQVQPTLSADLTTDSTTTTIAVDFIPDFWIIVCQATAGDLSVYPGTGKSSQRFRMAAGTMRLPFNEMDTLTVVTNGLTGWWAVYAIKNCDGFMIQR